MRTRIAFSGLLLALALVLSYVESLIPFSFGIPGIKLGLPNLVVVLILFLQRPFSGKRLKDQHPEKPSCDAGSGPAGEPYREGFLPGTALFLNSLRILIAGFLFGSLFSILYGLAGGLLSYAAMRILKTFGAGTAFVSIAGGLFHNLGQLLVAMLIVQNLRLIWYFPVLAVSGIITGALIGIAAERLLPYLRRVI